MEDRIHELILSKLAGDALEDDIIYEICQQAGVKWVEARSMLEEIKGDHTPEIEMRQFPIKGILTFVFVLLGIILILEPAIYLWSMLGITDIFLDVVSGRSRVNGETILMLVRSRCLLMSWFELPSILFAIMVGVAIIIVNIRSLGDTWKNLMYSMQGK
jgi:hypothetical protein